MVFFSSSVVKFIPPLNKLFANNSHFSLLKQNIIAGSKSFSITRSIMPLISSSSVLIFFSFESIYLLFIFSKIFLLLFISGFIVVKI